MSDANDATSSYDARGARSIVERQTNLPQLGNPPKGNSPGEAAWFRAVHDNLKAGLGTAASLGDRFVTVRDLLNSGAVTYADGTGPSSGGGGIGGLPLIPPLPTNPDDEVSEIPPDPIDFVADPGLTSIILSWDVAGGLYNKVGYAEIYANSAGDDLGNAVLIGTTTARVYADAVGSTGVDRWYYIRFIGKGPTPLAGNYFSLAGVHAKTGTIDGMDFSGLLIEAQNIADGAVIASKIADAVLTYAKFASGIEPVGLVTALPTVAGYTGPTTVLLETDGKLYRLFNGAWTAAVTATDILGQLQAGQLALNSVTAGVVAAGAITATEIAAGAIRAQNLLITATSLIPDTSFAGGAATWQGFVARYPATDSHVPPGAPTPFASRFNAPGPNRYAASIAGKPGDQFRARLVFNASGTANLVGFFAEFYAADGSNIAPSFVGTSALTGWQSVDFTFTAPANAASIVVGPYINFSSGPDSAWFGDLSVVRMADASLIVDGAVTADKVSANAIVAGKIAADAIAAFNIVAGSITGDRIAASTLTAANILAGTITGDRIAANTLTAQNIASRTIQAVQIAANTITAYEIQATSISADRLTVGAQGAQANLLKNSDWTENVGTNSGPTCLKNWTWGYSNPSAQVGRNFANGTAWNVGLGGAFLYDNADPDSGEFNLLTSDPAAAQPGQNYEASCYVAAINCIANMDLHFTRADGSTCASNAYGATVSQDSGPSGTLGGATGTAAMVRFWGKATAPLDASFVQMRLFKYARHAAYVESYMFMDKAFVTLDAFNQSSITNQSPWRDGGLTTIDGNGIVTNSVDSTKIKAGAITADKISVIELSDIASNAGIIVSGLLRNSTNSAAINLNAINSDDFIRVGNYQTQYDGSNNPNIALRADGSAYFSREVISKPRRIAFGDYFVPIAAQPSVLFRATPVPPEFTSTITGAYLNDNFKTPVQLTWLDSSGNEGGGSGGGGGGDGGGE